MQIEETIRVSFPGSAEYPALEDVVLMDGAGVALGVQRAFSPSVRSVRDGNSTLSAAKCVEIPLVRSDGEVSGILRLTGPRSDTRSAIVAGGLEKAISDVAQYGDDDLTTLFAVIGSGLRLLEREGDAAYRKAIVAKIREAITRSSLLSRQLLEGARPRPKSLDRFVAGGRLAVISGKLELSLRPNITVYTEIDVDLWAFNADPEGLYFALLNLCRNSADAMPEGGVISLTARNVERSFGDAGGFVEIVVADNGEGMSEAVLSQALDPYFTTKTMGSRTGLGLTEVRRFAEGRGGAIRLQSKPGVGTLAHLILPRVETAGLRRGSVGTEIAYSPSPEGGVFHIIEASVVAATS
jgi:signal transduction histidine kinase